MIDERVRCGVRSNEGEFELGKDLIKARLNWDLIINYVGEFALERSSINKDSVR